MTDERALLAAIESAPDDDTLRLAYADWLDEHDRAGGAYLRAELELAKLDPRSHEEAAPLRAQLLDQRRGTDPMWLARFEQPHLLRVNPTPFPAEWIGTDIPGAREVDGTYGGSQYRSLPPLPVESLRGDWKWLLPAGHTPSPAEHGTRLAKLATARGLTLPPGFVEFANDAAAQELIRSNTDCFFDWAEAVADSPAGEGGSLIRFYADSQGCVYWYLYATPTGYSCVVASPMRYGGDDDEDDEEEEESGDTFFCAPSFEAFVFRTWVENEIWHRLVDPTFDFHDPRPMTPEMQAYLDHYRRT
ncbi:TIGR02996 domain-containing protein [Gemmata sp.]|uniref:TIGR02996 domain-containing protein n=1 Tax=Gemmata sp. TaxID=1914242 RepID=UPI003F7307DD